MTRDRWIGVFAASVVCAVLSAGPVSAKLTPAQRCTSTKLSAQAKYVNAVVKCYTKTKFTAPADPACVQKASDKLTKAFTSAEKPGACKVNGDATDVAAMADILVQKLVQLVAPGSAATKGQQKCAVTKATAASKQGTETTKCHQQSLSTASAALLALCRDQAGDKLEATFAKAEAPGDCVTKGDAPQVRQTVDTSIGNIVQVIAPPPPRLVDNGDGTITDNLYGLMWEKKDDAGGVHDKDRTYTWSSTGTAQDGTAFTVLLATLNTPPCFAGRCNWRLPTSGGQAIEPTGQAAELESIFDPGCPSGLCVESIFNSGCMPGCSVSGCSCTLAWPYWSASDEDPNYAWNLDYSSAGGVPYAGHKVLNGPFSVRAVRGLP